MKNTPEEHLKKIKKLHLRGAWGISLTFYYMTNNLAVSHNERGRLELMMTRKFISCKSCNARDLKRRRRLRHGLSSFKTWCISNISGHALHRVDERHITTILNGNGDVDGKDIDGGRRKSVSVGRSLGRGTITLPAVAMPPPRPASSSGGGGGGGGRGGGQADGGRSAIVAILTPRSSFSAACLPPSSTLW